MVNFGKFMTTSL